MVSQLRSRLLYCRHQGAHRFLVALKAVCFLQLTEGRSPRTFATGATLALGSREGLPGTLFLHERRRRPWSDQNDQGFPGVLCDGLLTYRPIGDARPPTISGTSCAETVAAGAPSPPRILPVAVEQLLGVAGRIDFGDLAAWHRPYLIVGRDRMHLRLHALLRFAHAWGLRDSLILALIACWKHGTLLEDGLIFFERSGCNKSSLRDDDDETLNFVMVNVR